MNLVVIGVEVGEVVGEILGGVYGVEEKVLVDGEIILMFVDGIVGLVLIDVVVLFEGIGDFVGQVEMKLQLLVIYEGIEIVVEQVDVYFFDFILYFDKDIQFVFFEIGEVQVIFMVV